MKTRSLSRRVLVEHRTSGARKWLLRTQLPQLSPVWRRVRTRRTNPSTNKEQ